MSSALSGSLPRVRSYLLNLEPFAAEVLLRLAEIGKEQEQRLDMSHRPG